MFIRWQTCRSQARGSELRKRNDAKPLLKAILVESVRVDKPRQKRPTDFTCRPLSPAGDPVAKLLGEGEAGNYAGRRELS